ASRVFGSQASPKWRTPSRRAVPTVGSRSRRKRRRRPHAERRSGNQKKALLETEALVGALARLPRKRSGERRSPDTPSRKPFRHRVSALRVGGEQEMRSHLRDVRRGLET